MQFKEVTLPDGTIIEVSLDYVEINGVRSLARTSDDPPGAGITVEDAQRIINENGAVWPTVPMVDAIWQAADIKLEPRSFPPGPDMVTAAKITEHHNLIEQDLASRNSSGKLIAGHKKDIIRPRQQGRVTIYGWHRLNGRPIQPVYSGHRADYCDYSHGLRIIKIKQQGNGTVPASESSVSNYIPQSPREDAGEGDVEPENEGTQPGDLTESGQEADGGYTPPEGADESSEEPSETIELASGATLTITEQDRHLLELISEGESAGNWAAYWYGPRSGEPAMLINSLAWLRSFQESLLQRPGRAGDSSACGRYQFVGTTLWGDLSGGRFGNNGLIKNMGLSEADIRRITYSRDMQNAITLARLRINRKMDQWKSGTLSANEQENSALFMVELAKEFASIPVPYDLTNHRGVFRPKGYSFYSDRNNRASGQDRAPENANEYLARIFDIWQGGPGEATNVDITYVGPNAVTPATGIDPRTVAETANTGGARITGGHQTGRPAPTTPTRLPATGNVYVYEQIHVGDDRYDFRTGKKIRDIGINGTAPVSGVTGTPPGSGHQSGDPGDAADADPRARTDSDPRTSGPDDGLRGNPWTAQEAQNVEDLASFNALLGGGGASAQLTPGERAYARSRGYIGANGTSGPTRQPGESSQNYNGRLNQGPF